MLIDHIRSISQEFLHAQHNPPVTDRPYLTEVSRMETSPLATTDVIENTLRGLYMKYGPEATYGFLATFQFLQNWAKENKTPDWLDSQLKAVRKLGIEGASNFITNYLKDPLLCIGATNSALGDPIFWKAYVIHNQSRHGTRFELGTYALLGLLLLAEKGDAPSEITVTE